MKTNGEDMAFPMVVHDVPCAPYFGMTKRECFAAMILQGLMANPYYAEYTTLEESAVESADKLIAALNKEGGSNG